MADSNNGLGKLDLMKLNQLQVAVQALSNVQLLAQFYVENVERESEARPCQADDVSPAPHELEEVLFMLASLDARAETTHRAIDVALNGRCYSLPDKLPSAESWVRVYDFPAIAEEDMPPVIYAVYKGVLQRYHASFFEALSPETVSALSSASPRDLRLMIAEGVSRANNEQRTVLLPEDVLATKLRPTARSIGFV